MNTPTHAALNFLVLGRKPGAPRGWIVLAAVLPDVPMFAFYFLEAYVFHEPIERIFREIYFRPGWQTVFDVSHSIPIFLVLLAWFWWRDQRTGELFAASLLLHSIVDWPTHLEDAHAYFWPLWREPLPGMVSYWHRGSGMWMLELAIIAAALGWIAWEKSAAWRRSRSVALPLLLLTLTSASPANAGTESCDHAYAPFSTIPGAVLTATDFISKDDPPVVYTMWRGTVPSFDGLPLSVDVTIRCGEHGPLPLVEMNHGWTDDKTIWEETGRSDTVDSTFRPGSNSHWNNIWFASRGYSVLNYTARGWHDSCGPGTPGAIDRIVPAPQCLNFHYWIHTDDMRWEIRDTQWLVGALVESDVADPAKLAITGGSYGGGQTSMNALLHDRTMCGGAPVPPSLGVDPCAGKQDGELVPWQTPHGPTPLHWTVALPLYTWADSIQALFPNGRSSDGEAYAPPDGDHGSPLGIPLESYITGVFAGGQPLGNGFYAPPGVDSTSDVIVSTARTLAGNPFLAIDPIVIGGVHQFRFFKSPIEITLGGETPIFWVQGLTDALFTAMEPLQIYNKVRASDPRYPIKLFFGDIGHDYAAERVDEWDAAHVLMNSFLDYFLRPEDALPAPAFDVTATITRCLNPEAPAEFVNAPDWTSIHPGLMTLSSTQAAWTFSQPIGLEGIETDPVTGATIASPISYKGCRRMSPASTDPTVASWSFPLSADLVLLGSPVVDLTYLTTAPDTQLMVRIWDVTGDGATQGLVTRGAYRSLDGPGLGLSARFEIAANGYRFPAGHVLKVEVTANDAPYFQPSNVPAAVSIDRIAVTLPTR